jgi:hypothetical protein
MTFTARLLEILQMGDNIAGILSLSEKALPEPGQYLPVQKLGGEPEVLTHPLFRVISAAGQPALGPIPPHWAPGDRVGCLPPQGKGFSLADSARRVGLLALDGDPMRLLPLVQPALDQNAAVALFFQSRPHPEILDVISPSVEISPLSALRENLDWPDFLAVEADRRNLESLQTLFGERFSQCEGQVLVKTSMPCRGLGGCGVCAVRTRQGWRQVCTDGPVFALKELLHVAR